MTGDEFSNRFRLVEKLTDAGVTTYRGVDSRRGEVLVHLMPGPETTTPETLAERGITLAAIDELAYHECLDVEGMRVVVTTDLDDFTTYESWIDEVEQRARAFGGAVAEPEGTETVDEPPGQTTSARKEEPTGAVEPTVEADGGGEAVDETASETVGEGAEDAGAPGEFTRLFEASDVADGGAAPAGDAVESSTSGSSDEGAEPAVSEPVDDAAPPPPPEPVSSDESGSPGPPEAEPPEGTPPDGEAATAEEGGSPDQAPGGPGEYTRIMMQLEGIEVPRPPAVGGDASDEPASSESPVPPVPPEPPAPPETPPETSPEAPPSPSPTPDRPIDGEPELSAGPDAGGGAGGGGEGEESRESEEAREPRARPEREGEEGPGPYTRLMRRSAGGDGEEAPSRDRRELPYRAEPSGGARERDAGVPLSPDPDESDGYLDRLRGEGRRENTPPPPAPESSDDRSGPGTPPTPRPASPPPASSGPSEYTRIIRGDRGGRSARRPEPPSSAGAPPAPDRAPSSHGSSRKPIVIALVVAVVLLAAILIYFAMWGPPGAG